LADTVSACIAAIGDRLAAKGPLYEPDAEWTALRACAVALEDAARLLTATTPSCVNPDSKAVTRAAYEEMTGEQEKGGE